jgi:hypothetical protein
MPLEALPWPAPYTTGVYVVRTCPGFVKVGQSENITKRLRDLQQCTPYPVQFLGLLSTDQRAEAHYHELFHPWLERGEWFRFEGVVEEVIRRQVRPPKQQQSQVLEGAGAEYWDCLGEGD